MSGSSTRRTALPSNDPGGVMAEEPTGYWRSIVPWPFTMIFVTGWTRQSPSSGSTLSNPPAKPSPENPLPDRPMRLKEKVNTLDRFPGPAAVGNVNEKRPSPSPVKQVSGSLVPYRPSTPRVPGPVGTIPRTGPSHVTVPVSPPEVNTPDDGSTESPGCSAMAEVKEHCVFVSARAAGIGTQSHPPATTVAVKSLSP